MFIIFYSEESKTSTILILSRLSSLSNKTNKFIKSQKFRVSFSYLFLVFSTTKQSVTNKKLERKKKRITKGNIHTIFDKS